MTIHRRLLLPWAATALLLLLCLFPKAWMPVGEGSPRRIPHLDKMVHFGMFAVFSLCWVRAGTSAVPTRSRVAGVLAVAFALAVATELAQGLPQIERDPDPFDALADSVGAVVGVGVVAAWCAGRDPGGTEG